ncbi:MAG TPA: hypothetical protein PK528_13905, partial [Syntrophorhabdus sp.]|nr:hypothetical protein [Syntrophorhabdus sp.]
AEGQALLDQVVGQVGGGGIALERGLFHGLGVEACKRKYPEADNCGFTIYQHYRPNSPDTERNFW